MTGELEMCAAAFFRTIGKDVATADEFVMGVSLGQKWMTPTDAKALLRAMTGKGVLTSRDGYIRPSFDISSVDVPLAYRPPKDILSVKVPVEPKKAPAGDGAEDMFPKLMDVAVGAGMQRREFIQECNRIQKRLDVDISVAALIVLRDGGVPVDPYVDRVYGQVRDSRITPS